MTAIEDWRSDLDSWAIPEHLIAAAEESPYGWPADLVERLRSISSGGVTPTAVSVLQALGDDGTLLDVGAGTGRVSLPIAAHGFELTAVEPDERMADALEADAGRRDVPVRLIRDRWPEAAAGAGAHDVVLSANVVYDVADIGPFVAALHHWARRAVVIECGTAHPWARLSRYFTALHGIGQPSGPAVENLADVIIEATGVEPEIEKWARPSMRFADMQELLAFHQRRLVVPPARVADLADLLAPDVIESGGWLTLGDPIRVACTVHWPIESGCPR